MSTAADWASARPDGDDIQVKLASSEVPDGWWATFTRVAEAWERESRGQTWRGLALSPDGTITFESVDADGGTHAMRTYLDSLLEAVDREAERDRARLTAEKEKAERAAEAHASKLDKLADDLRSGS